MANPNDKPNKGNTNTVQAEANATPAQTITPATVTPAPAAIDAAPAKQARHPYEGAIFESWHFSVPNSSEVQEKANGNKERKLANVVLVMAGGQLRTSGTIKQKQPKGQASYVEFTFFQNLYGRAIDATDAASEYSLTEFRKLVASDYMTWRKSQGTAAVVATAAKAGVVADDLGAL